jgi:hypothetical protein
MGHPNKETDYELSLKTREQPPTARYYLGFVLFAAPGKWRSHEGAEIAQVNTWARPSAEACLLPWETAGAIIRPD